MNLLPENTEVVVNYRNQCFTPIGNSSDMSKIIWNYQFGEALIPKEK